MWEEIHWVFVFQILEKPDQCHNKMVPTQETSSLITDV